MRSPRSVTLVPIDWPSRSLKPAIECLALVTIGFWPAIAREVGDGALEQRRLLGGPADAHVDDDLLERRDLHHVAEAELLLQVGLDLVVVLRLEPRYGAARLAAVVASVVMRRSSDDLRLAAADLGDADLLAVASSS